MSEDGISKHDQVLAGLVLSLQATAMQHLGKITNPLSGEVARDLEQARGLIDILEMLKVKCREGTPGEILRMLDSAVMDLQMNYLDEMKKDAAKADEPDGTAESTGSGDEPAPDDTPPEDAEPEGEEQA